MQLRGAGERLPLNRQLNLPGNSTVHSKLKGSSSKLKGSKITHRLHWIYSCPSSGTVRQPQAIAAERLVSPAEMQKLSAGLKPEVELVTLGHL